MNISCEAAELSELWDLDSTGGAVILEDGTECPITSDMVKQACEKLEAQLQGLGACSALNGLESN